MDGMILKAYLSSLAISLGAILFITGMIFISTHIILNDAQEELTPYELAIIRCID